MFKDQSRVSLDYIGSAGSCRLWKVFFLSIYISGLFDVPLPLNVLTNLVGAQTLQGVPQTKNMLCGSEIMEVFYVSEG
jgi:hypothetical protein